MNIETLIKRASAKRARRQAELDAAEAELRDLVRRGFADGLPGPKIAEAAGISVPRVYQIRDGRR